MKLLRALREAIGSFIEDDCPTLAAAVAYYTVFSLPPLLFLLITVLTVSISAFSGTTGAEERARKLIEIHAANILGNQDIQKEVGAILKTNEKETRTWWKSAIGIGAVIVGASGVLAALQNALNRVWKVAPRKGSHQAWRFLLKRALSLAMVLGFGFILIVSFTVNTIIEVVLTTIGDQVGLTLAWANVANVIVSFFVIAILLAGIYRYLPDARIQWRDVFWAACISSLLFAVGKLILQFYFEVANPAAQLGSAAASLAAIFIWVYYTSMIVLLGAEFSKHWTLLSGHRVVPLTGAARTAPLEMPTHETPSHETPKH